jgi:hypothetical protein
MWADLKILCKDFPACSFVAPQPLKSPTRMDSGVSAGNVEAFVALQLRLLEMEKNSEVEETRKLLDTLPAQVHAAFVAVMDT